MPEFKNYDPARIIVTFAGIQLLGFMDGTFVSAERTENAFDLSVGVGGDTTRVRNQNRNGSITATLMAESPVNDLLSARAMVDELTGLGYGPALIKDLNGTTLAISPSAWIRKLPTLEYADTGSGREWIFDCFDLTMLVGGAVV